MTIHYFTLISYCFIKDKFILQVITVPQTLKWKKVKVSKITTINVIKLEMILHYI